MRAAIYARVSTCDQQTLVMQVETMTTYREPWLGHHGADQGCWLGDERASRTRDLVKGRAPPRDRRDRGLATGSMGSVGCGLDDDSSGIDGLGCRLRVVD